MSNKLESLADNLKLRLQEVNDKIYVYSNTADEWYIERNKNKLILFHKNTFGSNIELKHYHKQKEYKYINYSTVLKYIHSHDKYKFVKHSKNRMMELFNMIENNNIPSIKLN